jgi:hypothetical protein
MGLTNAPFGLLSAHTSPMHGLGEEALVKNSLGTMSRYVYAKAGAAITAGVYCQYNGDSPWEVVKGLTGSNETLHAFGVAMATLATGEYGWFLVEGELVQADVGLALTTTTWSVLDADATTGALTSAGNTTQASNTVGMVTVDDRVFINTKGMTGWV